ncbi:aldehyde dehydrogenase domain-containing protein [Biscogniauxia sp. FL1348]|nr:aldehyde dehydrogenase domain-containing protein [Biscogniauxia sp. FL1348]
MEAELTAPNGVKWTQPLGLFINNEFVSSSGSETITAVNPTTEEDICSVHAATAEDVDKAVKAARATFKSRTWKRLGGKERGVLLNKLADLAEKNAEILASLETWNNGKPYSLARNVDLGFAIDMLRYYAGWADKIHGQFIDCGPDKMAYTVKTPLGVVGQIIPWNFNNMFMAVKLGPAIACGNTVVLKASEVCPLLALYWANLIKEAGFPPGAINIINGYGREAGVALASHMDVDKISFTGSTNTGKEILKLASSNMKNVTLETGGKSPAIVFEDADLDNAALWTNLGIMTNSGQVCCATSRVLVHESIYTQFLEKFKAQGEKLSVIGDPFEQTTSHGPQVSRLQHERVLSYIDSGRSEGAKVYMGGKAAPQNGKGFYVEPTVFTDVKPHMRIYREEIFGPCVVVVPFKTEEEALEIANDTTYGLGSAVFTKNVARAHRVAAGIDTGIVYINSSNNADVRVPFGGTKQSGIGAEMGELGLAAYTYSKSVYVNLNI